MMILIRLIIFTGFFSNLDILFRQENNRSSIYPAESESFGSHMFKGSMVIPGGVTADDQFTTVKVNADHLGIDITVYLDAIVALNNGRGAKVKGETSSSRYY